MNKKSFTLIELLVVIAIIGILSSLVIARFSDWGDNARIANTLQWSAGVHRTLGANLVGHWDFNDGAGTTARDLSGYDNHGTLEGDPSWVSGVSGTGDYALEFEGNDYVDCGNDSVLEGMSALTIETWFRPEEIPPSSNTRIFEKFNVYYFAYRTIKGVQFLVHTSGGYDYIDSDPVLLDQKRWYHLVGVYDRTNIIFYINGIQVVTKEHAYKDANVSTSAYDLTLGSHQGASNFISGLIDEVHIYNTALTAEEVSRIYAESKGKYLAYE